MQYLLVDTCIVGLALLIKNKEKYRNELQVQAEMTNIVCSNVLKHILPSVNEIFESIDAQLISRLITTVIKHSPTTKI